MSWTTAGPSFRSFRFWKAPTENMICGDSDGNIGWQASAASPRRDGVAWVGFRFRGQVNTNGQGFRDDLPTEFNPERGWIGTANHDIHPPGYDPSSLLQDRLLLSPFRACGGGALRRVPTTPWRIRGGSSRTPIWRRPLGTFPLFQGWVSSDPARGGRPECHRGVGRRLSRGRAGPQPCTTGFGDISRVISGRPATSDDQRQIPPGTGHFSADSRSFVRPRGRTRRNGGGDGPTGASFPTACWRPTTSLPWNGRVGPGRWPPPGRRIATSSTSPNIDASIATNAPGQSGRPGSPYYGNLTESWGAGEYFPLLFTRPAVEARAEHRLVLRPGGE